MDETLKRMKSMTCGVIACELLSIPLLPFSVIKVNYQLGNKTIRDSAKEVFKLYGIKGFFNAFSGTVMFHAVTAVSKYSFYHMFRTLRQTDKRDFLNNMVNGCASSILGSVFSHPFDVLKNHQQRNLKLRDELKINGPKILYKGYSQAILRSLMLYSFLYPTYEYYKDSPYLANTIYSAPLALITSIIFTQPIDLIKTRMIAKKPWFVGYNPLAYYKGLTLQLARNVPRFWISMLVTEYIYKKLR